MQITIDSPSILLCTQPVDFRRSIDGLLNIVLSDLCIDPKSTIFIFYSRRRDKVKILSWHKNGFVLILKRLEEGRFFNASKDGASYELTPQQLSWLIAGLDWVTMSEWGELEYRDFH